MDVTWDADRYLESVGFRGGEGALYATLRGIIDTAVDQALDNVRANREEAGKSLIESTRECEQCLEGYYTVEAEIRARMAVAPLPTESEPTAS